MYQKSRWALLNNIINSRMADRVRKVVFTNKILAPADREQLQLAPAQNCYMPSGCEDLFWAQKYAEESMTDAVGPTTQIPAWPSKGVIERSLINIRNCASHLHIELNLDEKISWPLNEECTSVNASVLVALAASRMKLTTFSVAQSSLSDISEAMKTLGYELSSPMRSLQTFSYNEYGLCGNIHDRSVISGLLQSAIKLRNLTLMLDDDDYFIHQNLDPVIPGIFRANNFTHLETLEFSYMNVAGADLVATLSQCRCSLRSVRISGVSIAENYTEWFGVFGILAKMPCLSSVLLAVLGVVGQDHILFGHLQKSCTGKISQSYTMAYEGRQEVAAGLNDLLTGRISGSQ